MIISVALIIVTAALAAAAAFMFRSRGGAARTRAVCTLAHIAVYEIIAVAALEIFKYGYSVNPYTSKDVASSVFSNSHTATVSFLTAAALVCVQISLNGSRIGKFVPFLIISGAAVVGSAVGAFAVIKIEAAISSLSGEYASAIIPVVIGGAVIGIFAAANLLLDTSVGWQRLIMTVINLIDAALFATVFITVLAWLKEITVSGSEFACSAALFGIISVLPPIICMCSSFAPQTARAVNKKSVGKH